MVKVITYGTYDLLHFGHIKLLERAKALGDYLIVGVTADDFDKVRGKINVQQSLIERIENVRSTGLADEIIVEEYEGQKIDDIRKLDVDIFTVGSDWEGKFDYLREYCKVVYLDRTQGVSSSELRAGKNEIKLGLVGESNVINKVASESEFVNGVSISGVCTLNASILSEELRGLHVITDDYERLIHMVDAVYILSHPRKHYAQIKRALELGKHVLCESPISINAAQCGELFALAKQHNCVLMEAIKTAYSTAYNRIILLAKGGKIGEVVSVDATCTSLKEVDYSNVKTMMHTWNSITAWGPTALLPVFQLLGVDYVYKQIVSRVRGENSDYDEFTQMSFVYPNAVASIKVGKGIKSEGELIISGTKGYIYVPAPWWKTDYFEIRYEDQSSNKRYFYQLEGEGIRYELVSFVKSIQTDKYRNISQRESVAISELMECFFKKEEVIQI